MTLTTKVAALVAVLALALAGCGRRLDRDRTEPPAEQQQTAATTADPADALDDLDSLIDDVESALTEADAAPTDAD